MSVVRSKVTSSCATKNTVQTKSVHKINNQARCGRCSPDLGPGFEIVDASPKKFGAPRGSTNSLDAQKRSDEVTPRRLCSSEKTRAWVVYGCKTKLTYR